MAGALGPSHAPATSEVTVHRSQYIRKRLMLMVLVLFGVTIVIFSMVRLIPGDPAFLILGDRATEEMAAQLRNQLGLNKPLLTQYWDFVSGMLSGKMGTSLLYRQPVSNLLLRRVPVTLFLAVYATAMAAILTFIFGITAARNRGRWPDHAIRVVFLFFMTTPAFLLGLELIIILSLGLHLFPVTGYGRTFPDHLRYLFLPALTLALGLSAVLIRNLRAQIVQVGHSDYVRTARSKGLSENLVMNRHTLRNALIPVVTLFGLQFGYLVGGTVVVETVFALPGMGQLLFQSITARDYPVVQAITVVSAFFVIIVNLIVDLSYSFLDPRVTYE
jgi:peptide/nickel transport system permease protein